MQLRIFVAVSVVWTRRLAYVCHTNANDCCWFKKPKLTLLSSSTHKQFLAQYFEIKLGNLYSIVIFYYDVSSSILFAFVEHVLSYWINFFGTFSSDELGTFTAVCTCMWQWSTSGSEVHTSWRWPSWASNPRSQFRSQMHQPLGQLHVHCMFFFFFKPLNCSLGFLW